MFLYRAYTEASASVFNESHGFHAKKSADPNATYSKGDIERHLSWENRRPTPFISVTPDLAVAFKMGRATQEYFLRNGKSIAANIAVIDKDIALKSGAKLSRVLDLARTHGVDIVKKYPIAYRADPEEHFFIGCIPSEAVIGILSLSQAEELSDRYSDRETIEKILTEWQIYSQEIWPEEDFICGMANLSLAETEEASDGEQVSDYEQASTDKQTTDDK